MFTYLKWVFFNIPLYLIPSNSCHVVWLDVSSDAILKCIAYNDSTKNCGLYCMVQRFPRINSLKIGKNCLSFGSTRVHPRFLVGFVLLDLQFYVYALQIVVCPFVLFLLAIVLPVLLRYTDFDYPFDIFKLVLQNFTVKLEIYKTTSQHQTKFRFLLILI